jgi:hypothetical protein
MNMALRIPRDDTDSLASGAFVAVVRLRGTVGYPNAQCRWPISMPNLPDFCFCDGNSVEGRPYCEIHNRLAYRPYEHRKAST